MDIDSILSAAGGAASRAQFVAGIGRHAFDNAVKRRALEAVFPRAYAYPWDVDLPDVRRRAALASVGGEAALSHLSVLQLRDLPVPDSCPLHVTAYQTRHPRGVPSELVVHRTLRPLDAVLMAGLPAVRLERSLVASWPLLTGPEQRAPIIEAYRRRLISRSRLKDEADAAWWVRGVKELRHLVALVLAGCESQLELWGYTGVFNVPGLDDAARQRCMRIGGRVYWLDMIYDDEKLNVELDGRAFHASTEQWERDIARDVVLAKLGWQTLRLSHARLHGDVEGVRRDVMAVRAVRRRAA